MEPTDQLDILHVSDLHISLKDTFGRETVLGALVDRVKKDRKNGLQPEIVVVTGDIAKTGMQEEYTLAANFFNALLAALEELAKQEETDLSLYLFHHPLAWLWEKDRRICRNLLDRSIVLCGHLHDAAGGYFHDLDGSLFQFQAGAAYLGADSEYPNRYQHITIDWGANCILLDFRKFNRDKRTWVLDGETGEDGTKTIPLFDTQKRRGTTIKPISILEWPDSYCQWITSNYGHNEINSPINL